MKNFIFRSWVLLLPTWIMFWLFKKAKLGPFQWNECKAWRISNEYLIVLRPIKSRGE